MAARVRTIGAVSALRRAIGRFRAEGQTVALVPTMGALHDGHLALVKRAQRRADRVVVSIFVNPAQFAPSEDFGSYPRTFEDDLAALSKLGTDLVWAPASVSAMYPPGFSTKVVPGGPATVGLEDAHRPHFFTGVATVVAKLLLQVGADFAFFGEKDFQQLRVVQRMTDDLNIPVKIVGVPTVRERDGLAMSSRNTYLSAAERERAPLLYRELVRCAEAIRKGQKPRTAAASGGRALAQAGFDVDYFEARDAASLEPVSARSAEAIRLLAAARLGSTRLIDNIAV
jgi:pantoate--beta-alanine ligase